MITHEDRKIGSKIYEVHKFDSAYEMVRDAEAAWRNPDSRLNEICNLTSRSFIGRSVGSIDKLIKMVDEPWKEGLDRITEMIAEVEDQIKIKPRSVRRRRKWDEDDGDEVCNDRLRSGQPYWAKMPKRLSVGPRRVTVVSDVTTSAHVDSNNILWRGAVSIILCDLLEDSGYKVELYGVNCCDSAYDAGSSGKSGCGCLVSARLKAFHEPLDKAAIVNGLSGWFYRTVFFGAMGESHCGRRADSGLGYPRPISENVLTEVTDDAKAIVVEDVWRKEAAIKLIVDTIEKINRGELITRKEAQYDI